MVSLSLLTCLLICCNADISQDASDATCSQRDGPGCPGSNSEYPDDDLAMSFLQTNMNVAEDLAPVEDMSADCQAKVARLDELNGQDLTGKVGNDPLFPPTGASIAEPGTNCGDSAAGIEKSCNDYNTWKTFEAVSQQNKKPYSIIGVSGINPNDISQGELGNCYFLAALASIADKHPQIIENMFVEKELWSSGIFKTKWLVNGKESIIAVDNMIPAGEGNTFFTHPSTTGEWWPVVLAKAWAKIFGSFKAAESGGQRDVVTAITQSPSATHETKTMEDAAIWEMLGDAAWNKYPTYSGTGSNAQYGLAKGHAYSILGTFEDPTYGKVVKCRNPWHSFGYKGKIPNPDSETSGVFFIALSEFRGAFESFSYNFVKAGYKATDLSHLPAGYATYDLSVSNPGEFWVSQVWPLQRTVQGCGSVYPTTSLYGQLTTDPGKVLGTGNQDWTNGRKDYKFPGTAAGDYTLFADLTFKVSFLNTYAINVYAPGTVTIAKSNICADNPAGLKGLGFDDALCSEVTDASPKYTNVKCTGSENSAGVQKYCPASCGLCSGGGGGGGGGAAVAAPVAPAAVAAPVAPIHYDYYY